MVYKFRGEMFDDFFFTPKNKVVRVWRDTIHQT